MWPCFIFSLIHVQCWDVELVKWFQILIYEYRWTRCDCDWWQCWLHLNSGYANPCTVPLNHLGINDILFICRYNTYRYRSSPPSTPLPTSYLDVRVRRNLPTPLQVHSRCRCGSPHKDFQYTSLNPLLNWLKLTSLSPSYRSFPFVICFELGTDSSLRQAELPKSQQKNSRFFKQPRRAKFRSDVKKIAMNISCNRIFSFIISIFEKKNLLNLFLLIIPPITKHS